MLGWTAAGVRLPFCTEVVQMCHTTGTGVQEHDSIACRPEVPLRVQHLPLLQPHGVLHPPPCKIMRFVVLPRRHRVEIGEEAVGGAGPVLVAFLAGASAGDNAIHRRRVGAVCKYQINGARGDVYETISSNRPLTLGRQTRGGLQSRGQLSLPGTF